MYPTKSIQRNRRLILITVLVALGFLAGFVWGREYGYQQGKRDIMKVIEQKLAKPEAERLPI
jgi:hypothetical protein